MCTRNFEIHASNVSEAQWTINIVVNTNTAITAMMIMANNDNIDISVTKNNLSDCGNEGDTANPISLK